VSKAAKENPGMKYAHQQTTRTVIGHKFDTQPRFVPPRNTQNPGPGDYFIEKKEKQAGFSFGGRRSGLTF